MRWFGFGLHATRFCCVRVVWRTPDRLGVFLLFHSVWGAKYRSTCYTDVEEWYVVACAFRPCVCFVLVCFVSFGCVFFVVFYFLFFACIEPLARASTVQCIAEIAQAFRGHSRGWVVTRFTITSRSNTAAVGLYPLYWRYGTLAVGLYPAHIRPSTGAEGFLSTVQ